MFLPRLVHVCGLFCVSGSCGLAASVVEQVAQAQRVRHLPQRQHVPRAGPHVLIPPAPHGFGMGSETAVNLRPRQFRLLLEPHQPLREVVEEVVGDSAVVDALSRHRAGPSRGFALPASTGSVRAVRQQHIGTERGAGATAACQLPDAWGAPGRTRPPPPSMYAGFFAFSPPSRPCVGPFLLPQASPPGWAREKFAVRRPRRWPVTRAAGPSCPAARRSLLRHCALTDRV